MSITREKIVLNTELEAFNSAIRIKVGDTTPYQWPLETFAALDRLGTSITEADKAISGNLSILSISAYNHSNVDLSGILTANKNNIEKIYISTADTITNFSVPGFCFANMSKLSEVKLPTATFIGKRFISNCIDVTSISLPKAEILDDEAFYSYIGATENTVNLPEATKLGNSCFYFCSSIRFFNAPKVSEIGSWTFYSCSRIRKLELPLLTDIPDYAFAECVLMEGASFPLVSHVGVMAFSYAQAASGHSFPELVTAGKGAFHRNYKLSIANFPKLTAIADEMFLRCSKINYLSFPEVSQIGASAFWYCSGIVGVRPEMFPKLEYLGDGAFSQCKNLEYVELSKVSAMGMNPFKSCTALISIKLGASQCVLSYDSWNTPFADCPALAGIYVPSDYLGWYQNADGWSLVSNLLIGY